ncbi:MAG: beta-N-acetylhexosaminidase [Bordetella sp.]
MTGPFIIDVEGSELSAEERDRLQHPWVGGVILFARNFQDLAQLKALTSSIHALRPDTPLLITVDHEGGRIQRFREGFTKLPSFRSLGERLPPLASTSHQASYCAALELALSEARTAGADLAFELRAVGVDFSYTPVLDLDYGRSQVIGDRSFHREPAFVSMLAAAMAQGLAMAGFRTCGKHFPGHGWAEADSHHALPVDDRPLDAILQDDAWPYARLGRGRFERALLQSVMPAHVVYSQVDSLPAGFSRIWVTDILKGQLGFEGVVISDDLSMAGAAVFDDIADRCEAAFAAGCDATLICNRPDLSVKALDTVPGRIPAFLTDPSRRSLSLLRPRSV